MACRERRHARVGAVSAPERILVHAPILLFSVPIPVFIPIALAASGCVRVVSLLACWWCAAGAVMMCVDAGPRGNRYARLVALTRRAHGRLALVRDGLRQTLCGRFLLQALRYRWRTAERSVRKGVAV